MNSRDHPVDEHGQCTKCARPTVAFVGCGKQKQDTGEPVPAEEIYTSNYFQLKREFANTVCDTKRIARQTIKFWWVISAKHECIPATREIKPYDLTLDDLSPYERGRWAERTQGKMEGFLSFLNTNVTVYVLMGEEYAQHFTDIWERIDRGIHGRVIRPFRDTNGIGEQMAWLREQIDAVKQREAFATDGLEPILED
jgi:hypothetical protein